MHLRNSKGITLIENLVAIFMVSVLLVSIMGAFFVSKMSAARAKHRMVAMNTIREYMEREIRAGYDGGSGDEGDHYVTVSSAAGNTITVDDGLQGSIKPDPYYPLNIEDGGGAPLVYSGIPYKVIGFLATWQEPGTGQVCTERAVTYVCYHSSS